MIEVVVAEVSISNIGFALLLRPSSADYTKVLPIFIGKLELHSIQLVLEGVKSPRPMTHDLVMVFLEKMQVKVEKVVITSIHENTFFAEIVLSNGKQTWTIDARPSDCIALALRQKAPIFVADEVYENAGVEMDLENESGESSRPGQVILSETEPENFKSQEEILQSRLELAVESEDYEEAALLRDQINALKGEKS